MTTTRLPGPDVGRPRVGVPLASGVGAGEVGAGVLGAGELGAGELCAGEVAAVRARLVAAAVPQDDADRVDLMRALEELKAAVTAVQAEVVLAVDAAARQAEASAGVPAGRRGRGVPTRVGLAMRESPAHARSFLGAARAWHAEMPCTRAALRSGRLSAWRATVLVRETAHLPVEARARLDREVCGDPRLLEGVGTAALVGRVRRRAAELDPAAAADRARRAESERAVWIRPAPDTMTYVTALLPVAQGVGVYAALRRAADAAQARGEGRTRGQAMADTLVERVTGQSSAEAVPVMVNLVVSDATLLGAGHDAGRLVSDAGPGGGVVPAQVARNLVAHALDARAAWVRRLYADPAGRLVGASSSGRFYADGLAALLRARDQGLCRMPYCDAPIRHLDHVAPVADGGRTTADNGQGLCAACNEAKNSGALRQTVLAGAAAGTGPGANQGVGVGRHTVLTTTSTGHRYVSTAPEPPRPAPQPGRAWPGRARPAPARPAAARSGPGRPAPRRPEPAPPVASRQVPRGLPSANSSSAVVHPARRRAVAGSRRSVRRARPVTKRSLVDRSVERALADWLRAG